MNDQPVAAATLGSAKDRKTKIQVIARAASVLRLLEHEPAGLSLGAIAQRVKLPRSTVQRIVGALEAENLLIAASPAGRVKLGPALLRLSASMESSISSIAKPDMLEIARDLGQTVDLSILSRRQAICIDQAVGAQHPVSSTAIGETSPLHCTAQGKAMLALMNDAEIEQKLGQHFPARTEFTRTTLSTLLIDVHATRISELAYDTQEHTMDTCAVGVGFSDALGNRLALSISMRSARFAELKEIAAERLLALRAVLVTQLSVK
jgi:DNA-binding IclR family transcriptional regulator